MLNIALTGGSGLVGSRIIELLSDSFRFTSIPQKEMDITDARSVETRLNATDFDMFLHLAAYTNVDGAEGARELCRTINVEGTHNIGRAVGKKGKKLIYVSTDFVFDGLTPPYDESSVPRPVSYYGQTKSDGEGVLPPESLIVRISYPYRAVFEPKRDFVRGIKHMLEDGKKLAMVSDSLVTPTFIDDIAFGLKHIFGAFEPGVIHLVGADSLSPYEAALAIAHAWNLDASLVDKTTYAEYFAAKAKRPRLSQIISKKNTFSPMRTFAEGLSILKQTI